MQVLFVTSHYVLADVQIVGCIGDLMEELSGGLPILLWDSFSKFLIKLIGLKFILSRWLDMYKKEAASRSLSIFFIITIICSFFD